MKETAHEIPLLLDMFAIGSGVSADRLFRKWVARLHSDRDRSIFSKWSGVHHLGQSFKRWRDALQPLQVFKHDLHDG
jgi:hypothetical protein